MPPPHNLPQRRTLLAEEKLFLDLLQLVRPRRRLEAHHWVAARGAIDMLGDRNTLLEGRGSEREQAGVKEMAKREGSVRGARSGQTRADITREKHKLISTPPPTSRYSRTPLPLC